VDASLVAGLPPGQAAAVRRALQTSFMDGFHLAHAVPAVVLVVTGVIALRWIPSRPGARTRLSEEIIDEVVPAAVIGGPEADAAPVIPGSSNDAAVVTAVDASVALARPDP
jgi:hypothetical protein